MTHNIINETYGNMNIRCFLCQSEFHIATNCTLLTEKDNLYKLRYKDKLHKTEDFIEKTYQILIERLGLPRLQNRLTYLEENKKSSIKFFMDKENLNRSLEKVDRKKSTKSDHEVKEDPLEHMPEERLNSFKYNFQRHKSEMINIKEEQSDEEGEYSYGSNNLQIIENEEKNLSGSLTSRIIKQSKKNKLKKIRTLKYENNERTKDKFNITIDDKNDRKLRKMKSHKIPNRQKFQEEREEKQRRLTKKITAKYINDKIKRNNDIRYYSKTLKEKNFKERLNLILDANMNMSKNNRKVKRLQTINNKEFKEDLLVHNFQNNKELLRLLGDSKEKYKKVNTSKELILGLQKTLPLNNLNSSCTHDSKKEKKENDSDFKRRKINKNFKTMHNMKIKKEKKEKKDKDVDVDEEYPLGPENTFPFEAIN